MIKHLPILLLLLLLVSCRGTQTVVSSVTYYDTRTEAQKKALRTLIADLRKRFGANLKVVGHRDYNQEKLCPCFDVAKEKY